MGGTLLTPRKQTPAEFSRALTEELDLLLPLFRGESAPFAHDLVSEEATTADVERIAEVARKYLGKAVETATHRMNEAREAGVDNAGELKRLTDRTLENFVRCLLTPLIPIRLKSNMKGWGSIGERVDRLAEQLDKARRF